MNDNKFIGDTRESVLSRVVYLRLAEEIQQIAMTAMPRELEAAAWREPTAEECQEFGLDTQGHPPDAARDQLYRLLDELIFTARKIDMAYNNWPEDTL